MDKRRIPGIALAALLSACGGSQKPGETAVSKFTGTKGEVKLMTLDPGHFHAALIQKQCMDKLIQRFTLKRPEQPIWQPLELI